MPAEKPQTDGPPSSASSSAALIATPYSCSSTRTGEHREDRQEPRQVAARDERRDQVVRRRCQVVAERLKLRLSSNPTTSSGLIELGSVTFAVSVMSLVRATAL